LDDEMLKAVLSGEGMRSPKTNTSVE